MTLLMTQLHLLLLKYSSKCVSQLSYARTCTNLCLWQATLMTQLSFDAFSQLLTVSLIIQFHLHRPPQMFFFSLLNDRASRFQRAFANRRSLENNWEQAATEKHEREHNEKVRMSTPGELVHEQLERYKRCHQCKRKTNNVGETNIWCDTVYIPGSRYIC